MAEGGSREPIETPATEAQTAAAKGIAARREPLFQRLLRRGIRICLDAANRGSRHLITVHERPKPAALIGARPLAPAEVTASVAIVMQGPLYEADDYTLETLRLYRSRMPEARLILATWVDTDPARIAAVEAIGAEIVLCEKPRVPGLFNINMQITSARAGVRRAVELGSNWILKTRTDQRLYAPDALPALIALAERFPPADGTRQRRRIVGVGLGSLLFAPYHVTDQTVFGHAEDMALYWDPPLREAEPPTHWPKAPAAIYSGVPIGEFCRLGAAESYVASSYLERIGRRLDWTIEDSWAAYRDHFCFADPAMTDFYWIKGQTISRREYPREYHATTNRCEIDFTDWLMILGGILPIEAARPYEEMLDQPFTPFAPPW